jgi:hypothetical protein
VFPPRSIVLFALVTLGVVLGPSIALAVQLDLNWVDNSDGKASFIIQRAADGTASSGQYTHIAQVALGVTSYSDTAVSPGTTYCYQVAAVEDNVVSRFSRIACAKPGGGFSLAVTKAGTAGGTIVSSPPGIDCGTNCSYTYPAGKMVTLTAVPSPGSTFSGWSRGGCSGTGPCTMVGNVSVTVTATFAGLPVKIPGTVSSNRGGSSALETKIPLVGSFGKDGTK